MVHVLTCVIGRVSAGGDPDRVQRSPGKISREFEQFLSTELSCPSPEAETLGHCGQRAPSALHRQGHRLVNLKNARRFLSPFATKAHCLKEALRILGCLLCVFAEADTFFSTFDFREIVAFPFF